MLSLSNKCLNLCGAFRFEFSFSFFLFLFDLDFVLVFGFTYGLEERFDFSL